MFLLLVLVLSRCFSLSNKRRRSNALPTLVELVDGKDESPSASSSRSQTEVELA